MDRFSMSTVRASHDPPHIARRKSPQPERSILGTAFATAVFLRPGKPAGQFVSHSHQPLIIRLGYVLRALHSDVVNSKSVWDRWFAIFVLFPIKKIRLAMAGSYLRKTFDSPSACLHNRRFLVGRLTHGERPTYASSCQFFVALDLDFDVV